MNAKADAHVVCVEPALAHENVTLLANANVTSLETSPEGHSVTSVNVEREGRQQTYSADLVVLSCGAVNSAALLLRSANDRHPNGLANSSDMVGRHYMTHNNSAMMGFNELRYTMSPSEVERYRRLGQDAAQAPEKVCLSIEPGDSERSIAASLAFRCLNRNILPLVNLVAGDQRIARYRHPLLTENKVRKTILIALTGRRHGLHVSLTRLVSFGPADPGLLGRQQAVATVDARYILESRAGVTVGAVVAKAIDQYAL